MVQEDVLVSIVVPVYNVSPYIDRCLNSISNQTYSNLEVIVIVDGATDDSFEKCKYWQLRDSRIKVYYQKNCGLSITRNRGVKYSNGYYIAFVDSDDWINENYVKDLLNEAIKTDADIVICDYIKYDENGTENYVCCVSHNNKEFTREEFLLLSNTAAWNKLIKKKFWETHNFEFYNGISEDTAMFPMLILQDSKISGVGKALYYYEKYHGGSITSSFLRRKEYALAYQFTVDYFVNNNLFYKNKYNLYRYFLKWSTNSLAPCVGKINDDSYKEIRKTFTDFLELNFPEESIQKAFILGGYNLSKIVRGTSLFVDPQNRFQFSSICAIKKGKKNELVAQHKNAYRNNMLKKDIDGALWKYIDEERPDIFVLDLIEERYDLALVNDEIITLSELIDEADIEFKFEKIARISEVGESLWKKSCREFVENLKQNFADEKIILVENYLSEKFYKDGELFEFNNLASIRQINNRLFDYYSYFKSFFTQINIINMSNEVDYYSDFYYEYGCTPWHLNERINLMIADKIEMALLRGE